ncbi:50S ribosome-binding GTPase [Ignisphaera sp. 4213-co]|uniref:50S ribosome-binding GTPase n=1 Tax=Ignisphaera cupida TaxID=3050454 RepID=A0ABD4Z8Q3_9CREN|nr:GTPase [Ignisphaera sp. 4213-co]MDK6029280.1 50S ribosome-binding GTPase [Ignisphaera sp. 4213-co]
MRLLKYSEIRSIVTRSDVVLEVVEARNPLEIKSNVIEYLAKGGEKEYILVLNKCDLVPKYVCIEWMRYFMENNIRALCTSSLKGFGVKKLKQLLLSYAESKKPLNVSVFGLPKVGKSSLVNALKGKNSAPTSRYPGSWGYTKSITIYKILPGIYVIDTPGFIPPDVKELEMLIRSLPTDNIPNPVSIAREIIAKILQNNPSSIEMAYGVVSSDPLQLLEHIAVKRGWFFRKSQEPNIDEAAKTVIRDYLNGKITFYSRPPTRAVPDSS